MTTQVSKIKTFEGACKALKLNPKDLPVVKHLPKKDQAALVAHYKLIVIIRALNEGWEPNWHDTDQVKYCVWTEVKADEKRPGGFGFADVCCVGWYSNTIVGSRLCFKSRELALYAGKQFQKLYKEYFLIS